MKKQTIRFEISSISETAKKRIQKWCIDNNKTQGEWAEMAHKSLINKD